MQRDASSSPSVSTSNKSDERKYRQNSQIQPLKTQRGNVTAKSALQNMVLRTPWNVDHDYNTRVSSWFDQQHLVKENSQSSMNYNDFSSNEMMTSYTTISEDALVDSFNTVQTSGIQQPCQYAMKDSINSSIIYTPGPSPQFSSEQQTVYSADYSQGLLQPAGYSTQIGGHVQTPPPTPPSPNVCQSQTTQLHHSNSQTVRHNLVCYNQSQQNISSDNAVDQQQPNMIPNQLAENTLQTSLPAHLEGRYDVPHLEQPALTCQDGNQLVHRNNGHQQFNDHQLDQHSRMNPPQMSEATKSSTPVEENFDRLRILVDTALGNCCEEVQYSNNTNLPYDGQLEQGTDDAPRVLLSL